MVHDPEFEEPGAKVPRRRWVRWLVVYPVLALAGCHLAVTGSPIPLWHIERLRDPVAVREVHANALILDDGRTVRLPGVRSVPRDHALFHLALRHGVEVDGTGEVVGLIDPRRTCGNDAVIFYRVRCNLADLAAWLHPEGVDEAIFPAEEVRDLHTMFPPPPPDRGQFSAYDLRPMAEYRRAFERHVARADRP